MQTQRTLEEFRNEPFTDFSSAENAAAMRAAIESVRGELGREYPLIINGEKITLEKKFSSVNPAEKSQIVGVFSDADADGANLTAKAIDAATNAFKFWQFTAPAERAEYLFKAAAIIRARKHYFSAWMCFEAGKTWAEADGDTAEAIDFLEFYGREMLRWAEKQPVTPYAGEDNRFEYIPLGVGAIIPPWNFPLAIMCGMTMAAVVTGNTCVLKPSPDAPTIAYKFMEVLEEIGLPAGIVNFVVGSGISVGENLVQSPKIRFISFTGFKKRRSAYLRRSGENASGTKMDEARRRRNGRQGRDCRLRRCRFGFGGGWRCIGGVRVSGTEMFGVFAPDRGRKSSRRTARKNCPADE